MAVRSDGVIEAEVRHEYYAPSTFGSFSSRSNLQRLEVDCKSLKVRVVAMQIFASNNMRGESDRRENLQAGWTSPEAGSVRARTVDRICRAPTDGRQLTPP